MAVANAVQRVQADVKLERWVGRVATKSGTVYVSQYGWTVLLNLNCLLEFCVEVASTVDTNSSTAGSGDI